KYYHMDKGLALILLLIKNSILLVNRVLISNKETPYYILQILQTKLAPTNELRKRDIIKQYYMLKNLQNKYLINLYILLWENVYTEAKSLEISEVN
ncbi:hypothetical protein P170DRAFT_321515, partial [Aspergillus steynii IBT 23096]